MLLTRLLTHFIVASTPQKAGDTMIPSSKSNRKALGDLSSSQFNTRIAITPHGHTGIKPLNTKQSTISKISKGGIDKAVSVPSFSLNVNPVAAPTTKGKESTLNNIQSELYSTRCVSLLRARLVTDSLIQSLFRQSKYMDEDPYDYVMRTSSKAKVGLIPIISSNIDDSNASTNDFTIYQVKNEEYSCDDINYEPCPSSHDLQSLLDE